MSSIHLTTFIAAPIERVFDLTRNLAIYKVAFQGRKEKFTSGAGSNVIDQGDTITFHARHLGKTRVVTLKITSLDRPFSFIEEQVTGDLVNYKHEHHFKEVENGTIKIDLVDCNGTRDIIGKLFGKVYIRKYLEELIQLQNSVILQYAESEKWRAILTI